MATPVNPIPRLGNAAAKTALPQPKKIQVKAAVEASPPARQTLGRGESRQDSPKKVAGAHQSK